jgi:carbonic anhydrase
MTEIPELFAKNRAWAEEMVRHDPAFFSRLIAQQAPKYLWIGCSDSRVPANEIVGLLPGEMFVHRNVANVVVHTDLNCLTVMQYAVDVLRVEHILITGHYGCGGIRAALDDRRYGLIDNWLRHVQDVAQHHDAELAGLTGEARVNRLCELNVVEQVLNTARSTVVQDAWDRHQPLTIHGCIYGLHDGLLRDLEATVSNLDEMAELGRRRQDVSLSTAARSS